MQHLKFQAGEPSKLGR